jgi:hypothetical protein
MKKDPNKRRRRPCARAAEKREIVRLHRQDRERLAGLIEQDQRRRLGSHDPFLRAFLVGFLTGAVPNGRRR